MADDVEGSPPPPPPPESVEVEFAALVLVEGAEEAEEEAEKVTIGAVDMLCVCAVEREGRGARRQRTRATRG